MGFSMQTGYPEHLPALVAALEAWIKDHPVDFVLHGGDMVEASTAENLAVAAELFHLSVPVYLCLGNHDLTEPDSANSWLRLAPGLFGPEGVDYDIETADCVVHAVPNQWGESPYHWQDEQRPHFLEHQLKRMERQLSRRPDAVHIIATHSPVRGVPEQQTGHAEPFHSPPTAFTSQVAGLCCQHEQIRCVLGAHSHVNMRVEDAGVHCVTASSLVESPFELKLFEIGEDGIAMRTVSLLRRVEFDAVYDFDRTFVQGRERDRTFSPER